MRPFLFYRKFINVSMVLRNCRVLQHKTHKDFQFKYLRFSYSSGEVKLVDSLFTNRLQNNAQYFIRVKQEDIASQQKATSTVVMVMVAIPMLTAVLLPSGQLQEPMLNQHSRHSLQN